MSLVNIIRVLSGSGVTTENIVDNFSKTITYSVESTYNPDGDYRFGFTMIKNPTNNLLIDIYRLATDHPGGTTDGRIVYRKSTDFGQSWGTETLLFDISPTKSVGNFSAGCDSNGRIHLLVQYSNSNDFDYYYSDNDFSTLSSATAITHADVSLGVYVSTLCEIIQVGSTLYAPVYAATDNGNITESANYVLKSIDFGSNWTWTVVRAKSTTWINESTMVHLGGNDFLYVSRVDNTIDFKMYYSSDGANTFSDKGNTDFSGTLDATHPPLLKTFNVKNQKVVALYFFARSSEKWYSIYAKASDIVSLQNWTAFNTNTLTLLEDYSAGPYSVRTGYPTIQHPYNDLRGVFTYAGEVSISEAAKVIGILPTNIYSTLESELGL